MSDEQPIPRLAVLLSDKARLADPDKELAVLLDRVGLAGARPAGPLITCIEPGTLRELIARALQLDPSYEPDALAEWQLVELGDGNVGDDRLHAMLHALAAHPLVDSAFVLRAGPPPGVNAGDDPRSANQHYLDAAPTGIDARYAWGFAGGDGAGVGFVDLEQGWDLAHDDLAGAGISLISGSNSYYFYHGTSVLGEVLMVDNTIGGVGIATHAAGRVISQIRSSGVSNIPDAIIDAITGMAFGDVLLLEAQEYDPVGGLYYWPVEIADATYAAIRLATALGIVVVEAGCNGAYDLDAYTNGSGQQIFNRGAAGFRDSGAIMVGAAESALPHARSSFSNYGSRIDCYGWGDSIDTTTTDAAGTDNTLYTTSFSGTSGASPIVVGAALILQGIAQAALGYRFSPRVLRKLLTIGGTPSQHPATDFVGVLPNLRSIIQNSQLNLASDVFLRDYVGDTGNPTGGAVSASPDIIVRATPEASPQIAFGTGSGTENDPALSDPVDPTADMTLYVRVQNRGGSAAQHTGVDLYWSPPSTLVTPGLWTSIGRADLGSVPAGPGLTVSPGVLWPAAVIPPPGHYCFVAVAGADDDPAPPPTTFTTFANYVTYVTNNNNVAWRNFNVIAPGPSAQPHHLQFVIPGAFDADEPFVLESLGRLPRGSKVYLDMPAELAKALDVGRQPVDLNVRPGNGVAVALHPFGVARIGAGILPANSVNRCRLIVRLPKGAERTSGYEFAVRQLHETTELGRITWQF